MSLRGRSDLGGPTALFFDLEFTSWEDSVRTSWADPRRPAEILQIGAVLVDVTTAQVLGTFREWARPEVNPNLSRYCRALLRLDQEQVDRAGRLVDVMGDWQLWLNDQPKFAYWASWGREDLAFWNADCSRKGAAPPGKGRYQDLMRESARLLGLNAVCERRQVKRRLGIRTRISGRHDALADALDLVNITRALAGVGPRPQSSEDTTGGAPN